MVHFVKCVIFGVKSINNLEGHPFTNWKHAKRSFTRHSDLSKSSSNHSMAWGAQAQLHASYISGKDTPLPQMLDNASQIRIKDNREKLAVIIKAILFCGKQTLHLRGHRDDSKYFGDSKNNPGNFQVLLNLLAECGNDVLVNHFKKAPRNATYRSKTIQNDLITISGELIKKSIVDEIRDAKYFSIIADEATDCSVKEQMAIVLRFVDTNNDIREEFIGFVHCVDGTSGEALADLIMKEINKLQLDMKYCVGQGYDGAGNMAGKIKGVAARISALYLLALYFHCQSHKLNLCVVNASNMYLVLNMMERVRKVVDFFQFPKRMDILNKNIDSLVCDSPNCEKKKCKLCQSKKKKLKDCCQTRWVQRIDSFDVFHELYPAIIKSLTHISLNNGDHWNNDSMKKASSYLKSIADFDFIMALIVVKEMLSYTKALTLQLQNKQIDIADAFNHVSLLKATLYDLRQNFDSEFEKMFNEASKLAEKHFVDIQKPRTCYYQVHRENHDESDVKSYFKVSLGLQFLDVLIHSIDERF